MDWRIDGLMDWIDGVMDCRIDELMNRIDGLVDREFDGLMDGWIDGSWTSSPHA
jgi:hypothetical protein